MKRVNDMSPKAMSHEGLRALTTPWARMTPQQQEIFTATGNPDPRAWEMIDAYCRQIDDAWEDKRWPQAASTVRRAVALIEEADDMCGCDSGVHRYGHVETLAGCAGSEPNQEARSLTETVLIEDYGVPEDIAVEVAAHMAVEVFRIQTWADDETPHPYCVAGDGCLSLFIHGREPVRYTY